MPDNQNGGFWDTIKNSKSVQALKAAGSTYASFFTGDIAGAKESFEEYSQINKEAGVSYQEARTANKEFSNEVWSNIAKGDVKGVVGAYRNEFNRGVETLKNSQLGQENIAVAAPFWNAVAEGDFKGAGQAYLTNVERSHETLMEIGKADSFEGKKSAYQASKEEVMSKFRENCGEHIPDACEVNIAPPSCGIDSSHVQTKQNGEICK